MTFKDLLQLSALSFSVKNEHASCSFLSHIFLFLQIVEFGGKTFQVKSQHLSNPILRGLTVRGHQEVKWKEKVVLAISSLRRFMFSLRILLLSKSLHFFPFKNDKWGHFFCHLNSPQKLPFYKIIFILFIRCTLLTRLMSLSEILQQ